MSEAYESSTSHPENTGGREIGRVVGDAAGPTLIVVGGIHGNERAGVVGAKRALETVERRRAALRGELVAFAGNVGAMRLGVRYRERDLNRGWTPERIEALEARQRSGAPLEAEDREQVELLSVIRAAIARARGPVYLVDLHTTSAHGFPFVLFGDTLKQRKFAGSIPLAILLGLEEQIDGVLSAYWTTQGCITCGVEGGQHEDPGSVDNLEAVVLLGAEAAGLFGAARISETAAAHALLDRRRGELPRVIEVIARHAITAADSFVMEPGFANLARAKAGQLLARSRGQEVRAKKDGLVILPLYQGQGADGFFWGREMSPARLRLSETLRQMNVDRLLHLLPGVRRDGASPSALVVGSRAAKIYRHELFRLFGYRREVASSGGMKLERQAERTVREAT